ISGSPSLLVLALLLTSPFSIHGLASTVNAASCSRSDVGSAISKATYGDTVVVPAGTCQWTAVLSITKGIIFAGAGASQTVIQSGGIGSFMLNYTPDSTSVSTNARFE